MFDLFLEGRENQHREQDDKNFTINTEAEMK